ncbi:MAG: ATP-dependent Clp protease ATP-binding subunit, partial [Clostridia bacterium]|nr:ATP-dependent Clp protease ATP-binding subunit [Clostridia bacterium]
MYSFQNFTNKANGAMNSAIQTACEFGHTFIGTEHILVGLLKESDGVAAQALGDNGITLEDIEERLGETHGKGMMTSLNPNDLTPRGKRIIQRGMLFASKLGNNYVGTEHLLIALLNDRDSYAVKFINDAGGDPADILSTVLTIVGKEGEGEDEIMPSQPSSPFGGLFGSFGAQGGANASGKQKKSDTKTLDQYGRDLTNAAKQGEIDPVIGRQTEIDRVIQILSRRTKNNPCLIGEPGVGKTAVVEGLALRMTEGSVPPRLAAKQLYLVDMTALVAGTQFRGQFESRMKGLIDEVKSQGNVILFIDEVHTI